MNRRLAVLVALIAAAIAMVPGGTAGAQEQPDDASPRRLLIFALPGFTWAKSSELALPALDEFFADAAIADLAPRSVVHRSGPGEAYLTISAGTRATSDDLVEGQVLALDEGDEESPAGEIYTRRTGLEPDGEYVALGWPELVRRNDREPYDAVLGLLAETLGDEDVRTAVVANADGSDSLNTLYQRQAGLALAGTDGVLADGDLTTDLLVADPSQPFGRRMDADEVMRAFNEVWDGGGSGAVREAGNTIEAGDEGDDRAVVLVEASDLARTLRYRPFVTLERFEAMERDALREADALFARLMEEVDPERDAVLVLGPYHEIGVTGLTVAGLQRPGGEPGYLRSASTQRAGMVTLVDVAPTVLDTLDIARPVDMEGREFETSASLASFDERRDHLEAMTAASRFREQLLFPTTLVVVLVLTAVAALTVVAVVAGWPARPRRVVAFVALVDLAALPMSYLARAFPLEDLGTWFYWTFLVVSSIATAALATLLGRRVGPRWALIAVLALMLVVLVADVVTGSNLHLSAAFGYSPTGNSRLYGISNYSFGQLAAAACLLAVFIAALWPNGRGRVAAVALMGAVLVVLGVPTWGSDVGGVLAFTPTILVFVALLLRYRVRLRSVLIACVLTAAAVTAFGFIDLARPAGERAHLGRLFERIGNEGLEPLMNVVERKLLANLRVSTSSFWVAAIPVGIAFWLFLSRGPSRPLADLHRRIPSLHAGLIAVAVAAILGSALNDSGAIVGGVTLMVVTAALAYLALYETPAEAPS